MARGGNTRQQPIEVIMARGKSHKTKAEIEHRQRTEPKSPDTRIIVPDYITDKKEREKFTHYAGLLKKLNIWSELDTDTLGRYIVSQSAFERCIKLHEKALQEDRHKDAEIILRMQDRAFRQAHLSASDLGMTISSRCKLVVPIDDEEIPDL